MSHPVNCDRVQGRTESPNVRPTATTARDAVHALRVLIEVLYRTSSTEGDTKGQALIEVRAVLKFH